MRTHTGEHTADDPGPDAAAASVGRNVDGSASPRAATNDDDNDDNDDDDNDSIADNNDEPVVADADPTPLLHVVLDRPAIAGNVGAAVRLCAATGAALHVCGSTLDPQDRSMWRSGLDYWPRAQVHFHDSLERCLELLGGVPWIVEVGGALAPWDARLGRGNVVVLGPEKGSVQDDVVARHRERVITLPQRPGIRSLNLAQCAAVVVFEAVRQQTSSTTAADNDVVPSAAKDC
jgi:tRNA (cytidine/uridine-2'-O-)-methyltransferase